MEDVMKLNYKVSGTDFLSAGAASSAVKKVLRKLGVSPDVIIKVAIPMYEAEINMVIHANGGEIDVESEINKGTKITVLMPKEKNLP